MSVSVFVQNWYQSTARCVEEIHVIHVCCFKFMLFLWRICQNNIVDLKFKLLLFFRKHYNISQNAEKCIFLKNVCFGLQCQPTSDLNIKWNTHSSPGCTGHRCEAPCSPRRSGHSCPLRRTADAPGAAHGRDDKPARARTHMYTRTEKVFNSRQ